MEQKRSEAQRYIDVALKELDSGKYDNALKLARMANSIYPDPQVDDFIECIYKIRRNSQRNTHDDATAYARDAYSSYSTFSANENAHQRRTNQRTSNTSTLGDSVEYTAEQLQLARKITNCKNFYDVLNVSRSATKSEIKKVYKKLALQLHPDKNCAPGAADAFKIVANAVAVLTDENKRREYDATGANTISPNGSNAYCSNHTHYEVPTDTTETFETVFGEADGITTEELFNMFFGNLPTEGRRRRRTYQWANQRQPQAQHRAEPSLALSLILVLIVVSMISSYMNSDPVYSLTQSRKFPVRRETKHLLVPYYVKENFKNDYQGTLGRLENSVEEDFIFTMKQNCYRERSYREGMMARARSLGSRIQYAQAQTLKMPSCDSLSKIGITRYSLY